MLENQPKFQAFSPEVGELVLKTINAKECKDNLMNWKKERHNSIRFSFDESEGKSPPLVWHYDLDVFLKGVNRILFALWEELREHGEFQLAEDLIRPKL